MIKLVSFNIQNKRSLEDSLTKARLIKKLLVEEDIDILGLQEVNYDTYELIKALLSDTNYKMVGDFRADDCKFLRKFNEANPIITRLKIEEEATFQLPHFPAILPRIYTRAVVKIGRCKVAVYNTHLDYMFDKVRVRELAILAKVVKEEASRNFPIVMGDFNVKINKETLMKFTRTLKVDGVYRVELNTNTFKKSSGKRAIDHMFIHQKFMVNSCRTIRSIKESDHYPIEVIIK